MSYTTISYKLLVALFFIMKSQLNPNNNEHAIVTILVSLLYSFIQPSLSPTIFRNNFLTLLVVAKYAFSS